MRLVTVIFAFFCVHAALADIGSEVSNVEALKFIDNANVKDKEFRDQFSALTVEQKKVALGQLNVYQLFDFAQDESYTEYHDLAAEAYGATYGDFAIVIVDFRVGKEQPFQVKENSINFQSPEIFGQFLKSFGRQIKTLKLNCSAFYKNWNEILNAIEKYCAATITKLEIRHIYNRSRENWIPKIFELNRFTSMYFPKVEELSFFGNDFYGQEIELKAAFPNVRRLASTFTDFSDRTWVERNFDNLTHLLVDMEGHQFTETEIVSILEKNPEVTSLSISYCYPNILRIVNEKFPKIVKLGIISLANAFYYNKETVHMNHVETFLLEGIHYDTPHFITFEHLKELLWDSISDPEIILLGLIEKYKDQIEYLEIEETPISDEHLRHLDNMTHLEKASFRFDNELIGGVQMTANGLLNFFKSNQKLNAIRLFEAEQPLRFDLFNSFNVSGIGGEIEAFDPFSTERGYVDLTKNTNQTTNWDDSNAFLRNNFFV